MSISGLPPRMVSIKTILSGSRHHADNQRFVQADPWWSCAASISVFLIFFKKFDGPRSKSFLCDMAFYFLASHKQMNDRLQTALLAHFLEASYIFELYRMLMY